MSALAQTVWTRVFQLYCGLGGHNYTLGTAPDRIFLTCLCGHESPGWAITKRKGA